MLIDIHIHTKEHSADASLPAPDMVDGAIRAGLNGVILTDHGYCWPDDELEKLRRRVPPGFFVGSGAEIIIGDMHYLIYGCPGGIMPCLTSVHDLSRYIRRYPAVSVVAHPYHVRHRTSPGRILSSGAAGLECYNARRRSFELRNVFEARSLGMAELGGSDEHGDGVLGMAATWLPKNILTMTEFVTSVSQKHTRAWRRI